MRLGELVIRMRETTQLFQNRVGGAAEYALAQDATMKDEMAFILPLAEVAEDNTLDNAIDQNLIEQFAVVVAIKNDTNFKDKTGFASANKLHEVRQDLFGAFLGYDTGLVFQSEDGYSTESLIYYKGGQLLDINRAYMWYQFTFEYSVRITSQAIIEQPDSYLDRIYAQYVNAEFSDDLPVGEDLPVSSFAPDMSQLIDLQALRDEL